RHFNRSAARDVEQIGREQDWRREERRVIGVERVHLFDRRLRLHAPLYRDRERVILQGLDVEAANTPPPRLRERKRREQRLQRICLEQHPRERDVGGGRGVVIDVLERAAVDVGGSGHGIDDEVGQDQRLGIARRDVEEAHAVRQKEGG